MSMMEPDDAEWMPADDPAAQGMHGGWMNADQYDERVWGLPPRPPPGVRPPTGQLPGRPVWPFWGYWGYRLRNAQRDIKYLAEVVNDILDTRLEQLAQTGIAGVTDGSNAAPGSIGEFISATATVPYEGYSQVTNRVVSAMTVPPGDWDLWAAMETTAPVDGAFFTTASSVAGLSNSMDGGGEVAIGEWVVLVGRIARGNFSVSTLLPFQVKVDNSSTSTRVAGTATLTIEGRRRR